MAQYGSNIVLSNKEFNVVGTRPIRHDGTDKVTGKAKFGADYTPPLTLHGAVLRSPHPHAEIISIDTAQAESLEGVLAVITSEDFPKSSDEQSEGASRLINVRDNVLADKKVLYQGHPIGAVAAINQHIAEEAVKLIQVKYRVLKPVFTAPEGALPEAPLLHPNLKTQTFAGESTKPSNIAKHFRTTLGDIEQGFKEADFIVEREFTTKTVHQGYIEPHAAVAFWNRDGKIDVWCSTQGTFVVRDRLSDMLKVPVSQITVTPLEIGGGFGGKIPVYLEPLACLLSKKTGSPVKLTMTRKAVFESTGPTPGSYIKLKVGATKSGKIIAAKAYMAYEAGAFPGSPIDSAIQCISSCYAIPNLDVEGIDVVVNKPKTAAYRAPGATNPAFAMETIVNELADKIGIDELDFRLLNASHEGTFRADGPPHKSIGVKELIEAMKNHDHWKSPIQGPYVGRGVAIGLWFNIGLPSSCSISVRKDGTVALVEGNPDIGGTRVSISMQAAEVLGIRAEDVQPTVVNTDLIGFTGLTAGSRTTFATGWAAYEAAQDVKQQMIDRAAIVMETESKNIDMQNGVFKDTKNPDVSMTFKELASQLDSTGGPIMGQSTVNPKGVGASASGCMVDLAVDPETGKITILRFTGFQDAGKAVHPSYVEGQIQGGSVQGIGWSINEEYFYGPQGDLTNSTFLDYRMPTALDLPMIDTVIVEVPNPGHPYGVRGVGEASIIPPPAAIANAIHQAIGLRMNQLPMNPTAILEGLWNSQDSLPNN
ncbi:xanthine dehydrogenase family protein molybdopterin-binding subunit [SAR202 cluster bacterium AC-409-J13_OGT_754m]|nr:xanthine dehydrogenase family protein molybdopterin-binding subunit [SAR202 cluster bacterium AC-409-J13_OGT_754m]